MHILVFGSQVNECQPAFRSENINNFWACVIGKKNLLDFLFVMDIKKLIFEVKKHAEIWDSKHHQYHHRTRIIEIWSEISLTVGFSSKYFKIALLSFKQ